MPGRRIRSLSDPNDLRALAHPLRLRLLGSLRLDGPATATELARRYDVSSGLTSYHLRALADRGFVEDDPGHDGGRERWWRAADDAHEWQVPAAADAAEQAGGAEAARALNVEGARMYGRWLEKVSAAQPELDDAWRAAAVAGDRWLRLSPEAVTRLGAEFEALLARYEDEAADEDEGARRVGILFAAFPDDGRIP